jgi:hypothetical protein
MYAAWVVASLQIALYVFARAPWQAMVVSFVGEACWAAGLLVWVTLMQRVVPAELLGRVKSIDWLVSTGLVPVSFAVTGPMAAWLGVETVMLGAGLCSALLTVVFLFLPGMRDTELEGSPDQVVLSEPVAQEAAMTLPSSAESLAASRTSSPETAS